MKKIFRFQYEPCSGTCYSYDDRFFDELKKAENLTSTIDVIVKAHDSTCDDPSQRFGIDYDEENNLYIGSFLNGTRLDLFSNKSFLILVNILTGFVLKQNENKIINKENCVYGINGQENLAQLILNSVAA